MSYISFSELWGKHPPNTSSANHSPPDVGFGWGPPRSNSVQRSTNPATDGVDTVIEESDEEAPNETASTSHDAERHSHNDDSDSRETQPEGIGYCERALMEGVALIIVDFILLHCHLQQEQDLLMIAGIQPKYMWNAIKDVIGAACVLFPMEVFHDCLARPRTNREVIALQVKVGQALVRIETQERNQSLRSDDEVFTSDEFGLLYQIMLFHNMRVSGFLTTQEAGVVCARRWVTDTLHSLRERAEKEPLGSPTWFNLSDRMKTQKLMSAHRFLTQVLPQLARREQDGRSMSRLERLATELNPQDQEIFFNLHSLKLALTLLLEETTHRESVARSQTPSPLRSRRDSLAERKSNNMPELIWRHNMQRMLNKHGRP